MVSEAETQKLPTQRFTDRFERAFVPAVLGLVALLLFAWVVVDEPVRDSFYRAMAVLVAASPCALAIATSSAVLSGIAHPSQSGSAAERAPSFAKTSGAQPRHGRPSDSGDPVRSTDGNRGALPRRIDAGRGCQRVETTGIRRTPGYFTKARADLCVAARVT